MVTSSQVPLALTLQVTDGNVIHIYEQRFFVSFVLFSFFPFFFFAECFSY